MFEAKSAINGTHIVWLAEQVASRVWVIRTKDFSAWKKDIEFWRRSEKGRHDWKVELERKSAMKAEQVDVTFELYPLSKGVGKEEVVSSMAATTLPLLLEEGASVEEAVVAVAEEEESPRRRRSSFTVANLQAFGLGR